MRGTTLRSNPRPANSMEQDSFDSYEDPEDMLVMSTNNMRLRDDDNSLHVNSSENTELPRSVIVTNVDISVFDNKQMKENFEATFREFESNAIFHYLRSFRRIRVDFESHLSASKAKVSLDNSLIGQNLIHVYFIQVQSPCPSEDAHLHVPPVERQFLISPPASPPVGWEQPREDKPVVDYDLMTALAELSPGEKHELHPTKQINVLGKSVSTPSIVVHVADDDGSGVQQIPCGIGKKIKQTSSHTLSPPLHPRWKKQPRVLGQADLAAQDRLLSFSHKNFPTLTENFIAYGNSYSFSHNINQDDCT